MDAYNLRSRTLSLAALLQHINDNQARHTDWEAPVVIRGEREDYAVAAAHWEDGKVVIDLGRVVSEKTESH